MAIKKMSDFKGQVGKVCSRIRAARTQIGALVEKRLGDLAVYEQRTIERAFRHGSKTPEKGPELFIFTPDGEKLCTVDAYLKGTYRAFGQGNFQKKMWYDGIKPGNDLGRRTRKNQVVGGHFTKGTGRFSKKEKKNIRDTARKEITQRKLAREIRRVREEQARITEAETKKAERLQKRRDKLEKQQQQNASLTRTHQRRIVRRRGTEGKYDVSARDVQTHQLYRQASRPGEAPRSWDSSANYLRNHVFTRKEDDGYIVFLPVSESGDDILERLEYGGTTKRYAPGRKIYGKGDLLGYTVTSQRDRSDGGRYRSNRFSHTRVTLSKRFAPAESIDVKPRPVFGPARERVRKKLPTVFKDIQKLLR